MPKPRKLSLETATARLRLAVAKKVYRSRLGPGLSLGYRRNEGAGTWSVIAAKGDGQEWLKKIGAADDHEPADDARILSYSQAVDRARRMVHGDVPNADTPKTLEAALSAYGEDLRTRGARTYDARWPLKYLPAALLLKPVSLVDANELRRWRDSLLADHAPATVNRLAGAVTAALNLAAAHNSRIKSNQPWKVGLQAIPDANKARNMIQPDEIIRRLVDAAYARGERFGLMVEVLATTGTRPSQASRIDVGDLRLDNPTEPRLMIPRSGKGGGRMRVRRKTERVSVPITVELAARLQAAAGGRAPDAPLLRWKGDRGWGTEPSAAYRDDMRSIVAEVGLDPNEVTSYVFRHSSICRQLMVGVPVRVVASTHDTSVTQIEAHYSKYISEHSDLLSRKALLQLGAPAGSNVIEIAKARV